MLAINLRGLAEIMARLYQPGFFVSIARRYTTNHIDREYTL